MMFGSVWFGMAWLSCAELSFASAECVANGKNNGSVYGMACVTLNMCDKMYLSLSLSCSRCLSVCACQFVVVNVFV